MNTERKKPRRCQSQVGKPNSRASTIEQIRQGNEINSINQPVQQEERFEENETCVVENKEATEEIKIEILKEFFKTQNMNIEE